MLQGVPVQASRWKMAGKLEPLKVEPLEVAEESEEAEGSECRRASPLGQKGGSLRPITVMKYL